MTYNFDPDRWYENELAALAVAAREGRLHAADFEQANEQLVDRYAEMLDRLDGTYPVEPKRA